MIQNGRHFIEDIFMRIFLNATFCTFIHWGMLTMAQQINKYGSYNGLLSTRWWSIIWTKVGLVHWRTCASIFLNVLNRDLHLGSFLQNRFYVKQACICIILYMYFIKGRVLCFYIHHILKYRVHRNVSFGQWYKTNEIKSLHQNIGVTIFWYW